ncbi:MAG: hypothetical protein K0R03_100 [Moraxellaceae bacterium]|nr:hypothetical protein [Moraxellaceae bacterium]
MSGVSGQDGLTVVLRTANAGATALQIKDTLDSGTALQGIVNYNDVRLQGKSNLNSTTVADAPVTFNSTLDVGSNTGTPFVSYGLQLTSPARLTIGSMTLGANSRSFGTWALEGQSAQFRLVNSKGLFNMGAAGSTYLFGEMLNATLFYRQLWHDHPYLVMDNLNLRWEIPKGTLGLINAPLINSSCASNDFKCASNTFGIYMASGDKLINPALALADTVINLELGFELKYRDPRYPGPSSSPEFVRSDANAAPMLNFAWKGAVKDARLIWGAGGAWSSTGAWNNQTTASQGLRFETRWNYINNADAIALGESAATTPSEFRWRFAESGGLNAGIELSDWVNMPGATYGHNFPVIAMDVIPAGNGPGGAAGGLCWGGADNGTTGACSSSGSLVRLAPGEVRSFGLNNTNFDAFGIMVRDGNLLTYSNRVKIMRGTTIERVMDWGLIYTLANLDGNIFLYPGGNPSDTTNAVAANCSGLGSRNCGIVADILLMSQSFDASNNQNTTWNKATHWDKGTHIMIADTKACSGSGGPITGCGAGETGMGIGLIGSSILWMANDTRVWVKRQTTSTDYESGGIDFLSPQMRFHIKGTFGGGTIPNGTQIVRGGLVDINLEGLLNFRASPSAPGCSSSVATTAVNNCYLGYSMAARLYDISSGALYPQDNTVMASGSGSYVSVAELNRPDMPLSLGGISGDFAITNGRADMRVGTEDGDGIAKLRISNDILFGSTANSRLLSGTTDLTLPGGNTAQPFAFNTIALGPNRLGAVVIPSGQWSYALTLKPQTP